MHWSNQRNEIRYIQLNPSENYSHFSNLEIFHFNVIIHNDGLIYSLKKSAEYFKRIVKYFIWDGWRRRANERQRERERETERTKTKALKSKAAILIKTEKKHTHHAPTTTNQSVFHMQNSVMDNMWASVCGHDVSIPSPNSLSLSNSDAKRTNSHRLNGNNNAELRLQIHCVYAQAYICSTCSTIYLHLIVCQLPMFDLCALYRSRCIYLYLLSVYQPACLPGCLPAGVGCLSVCVRVYVFALCALTRALSLKAQLCLSTIWSCYLIACNVPTSRCEWT